MGCFGNSISNDDDKQKQKEMSKKIEKQLRDDKIVYCVIYCFFLFGNNFLLCMVVLLGLKVVDFG